MTRAGDKEVWHSRLRECVSRRPARYRLAVVYDASLVALSKCAASHVSFPPRYCGHGPAITVAHGPLNDGKRGVVGIVIFLSVKERQAPRQRHPDWPFFFFQHPSVLASTLRTEHIIGNTPHHPLPPLPSAFMHGLRLSYIPSFTEEIRCKSLPPSSYPPVATHTRTTHLLFTKQIIYKPPPLPPQLCMLELHLTSSCTYLTCTSETTYNTPPLPLPPLPLSSYILLELHLPQALVE